MPPNTLGNNPGTGPVPFVVTSPSPNPSESTFDAESGLDENDADNGITVYWRPGCMFCMALRRQLGRHDVPHRLVDIHQDPQAAAFVRSVANGNETVPTVAVGSVSLVNPSIQQVLAAAMVHAPGAVPDGYEPPSPGRLGRIVGRLLGG